MTDYALPDRDDIAGSPSNATAKTAMGRIWDFIASRLGGGVALSEADRQATLTQLGLNTLAGRGILHNGAMQIDQRNAGAQITPVQSSFAVDRWGFNVTAANKFTAQQNRGAATCPPGFSNYLGMTVTSAYTPIASDAISLAQGIESNDISRLGWGTAQAQAAVLSFWVRSSLTGTFGGALTNYAKTRSFPFAYTITSANTWQFVTVTIPADAAGVWVKNSNAGGAILFFSIGTGSNLKGTAGAWASGNYQSANGAAELLAVGGATLDITGIKLEAGSLATGYEMPSSMESLLKTCWRFYYRTNPLAQQQCGGLTGVFRTSSALSGTYLLPVWMRSAPSVLLTGANSWYVSGFSETATHSAMYITSSPAGIWADWVIAGGATGASAAYNGIITFSAELV